MYLNRANMGAVKAGMMIQGGVSSIVATGWGALVGYRAKKAELITDPTAQAAAVKNIMPHAGPIPADVIVAGVGIVGGVFAGPKWTPAVLGLGFGSLGFFGATLGQDLGRDWATPKSQTKTPGLPQGDPAAYRNMVENLRKSAAAVPAAPAAPPAPPSWASR